MQPTVYQKPEIRDANDNIIQQGAFGKNTALANATNDGWIDYVANDLEFLYDLAKDEVVPVPSLPASGQLNKTYLLTTTGVSYRWSGTEWVAVSSSEAVGRAESAALLAEQWATKTDGSVDGTEYSAKYYAQQAEQSADDAQDVADDMADHLVQIDKNTGGVAKNSKRISNIEKLLQGNLYDYDTDDDTAYTKTVPSGALPYAGIEQIGGKTLVWNQLINSDRPTLTSYGITFTNNEDGSFTLTGTSTTINVSTTPSLSNFQTIAGHKYYVCGTSGGTDSTYGFRCVFGTAITVFEPTIYTETVSKSDAYIYMRVFVEGYTVNTTMKPQVFDLTLMFGSGNEPTTVAEFEAMFPASYYPYNAGTLLSAGVTEVVSRKNLLYGQTIEQGGISNGADYLAPSRVRTEDYIPVDALTTYNLSVDSPTQIVLISYYKPDKTYIDRTLVNDSIATDTTPANAGYLRVVYGLPGGANLTPADVANPFLTPATPLATYPIPAEVRALEGYGWSAGTAYNYIDFERKVFVKRVARVDLGTLTWTTYATDTEGYVRFLTTSINTVAKKDGNILCAKYMSVPYADTTQRINGINLFTNGNVIIYDSAYATSTATQFTSAMSGVYAYYELATPVETDISQYLTDNIIEVGAGGTLTFPNQNGADYHIPVPSTETYMIDLQEAIENGN